MRAKDQILQNDKNQRCGYLHLVREFCIWSLWTKTANCFQIHLIELNIKSPEIWPFVSGCWEVLHLVAGEAGLDILNQHSKLLVNTFHGAKHQVPILRHGHLLLHCITRGIARTVCVFMNEPSDLLSQPGTSSHLAEFATRGRRRITLHYKGDSRPEIYAVCANINKPWRPIVPR